MKSKDLLKYLAVFIITATAVTGCGDDPKVAVKGLDGNEVTGTTGVTDVTIGDLLGAAEFVITDADGDGYGSKVDCDDGDAAINPGAEEVYYNGVDEDCDAMTADDDQDGDNYTKDNDCDDLNQSKNPGATEFDDGIDSDCDGDAIELGMFDKDNDGFTAAYGSMSVATPDCNDSEKMTHPAALEISNDGIDNDCDATTKDNDADGDGDLAGMDCNDQDPAVNHSAAEVYYDGIDNDCNVATDDADRDGDGFLATAMGGDDCVDTNAAVNPGQVDVPGDGIDNDCTSGDVPVSATNGVFVGKNGNDTTGDGSIATPYLTIQKGTDEAANANKSAVYVSEGYYQEGITTMVSLFAGFNQAFDTLNPQSFPTMISGTIIENALGMAFTVANVAIVVEEDTDVEIYGLSITAWANAGNPVVGIDVDARASLSIAASAIKVINANTGSSRESAGINTRDGERITTQNVDITLENSGTMTNRQSVFHAEDVQRFVVRGGTVLGVDSNNAGGTTSHYLFDLNGGYANVSGIVSQLDGSVAQISNYSGAFDDAGTLIFANNTINIPSSSELGMVAYLTYTDDGWLVADGNQIHVASAGGNSPYFDYAYYAGYGRGHHTNNKISCTGNFEVDYFAYSSYGALYMDGNSVDCGVIDLDNSWYYTEYGMLYAKNNDFTTQFLTGNGGNWNEIYYEYEGHMIVEGDSLYAAVVSDSIYPFYNNFGRLEINDVDWHLGEVQDDFEGYQEGGATIVDDWYFEVVTLDANGSTYFFDDYEYGGIDVRNSQFIIRTKNGSGNVSFLYNEYAMALMQNNLYQIDLWASSGDLYIFDGYYESTDSLNDTAMVKAVDKSVAGDVSVYENSDYGGYVLDGLYVSIADGFSNNYGIICYDCGAIIRNSELHFGGVANDLYGITNDYDYGSIWVENTILTIEGYADTVYMLYQYDSDFAFVNSVAVNNAAVTSEAYGIYAGGYGSVEIINSYIDVGGESMSDALEVQTLTLTGPATNMGQLDVVIAGEGVSVSVVTGDTAVTIATNLVMKSFPGWTAVNNMNGTVTFTATTVGKKSNASNVIDVGGASGAGGSFAYTAAGAAAEFYMGYSSSSMAHIYINSIFAQTVTNGVRYGFDYGSSSVNAVMLNNIFEDAYNWDVFVTSNDDGDLDYATYAQCDSLECSVFAGNRVANAMLVDPENGDYHLMPGSPAINAGVSTAPYFQTVPADFEGDPRLNRPDIGPDETQ